MKTMILASWLTVHVAIYIFILAVTVMACCEAEENEDDLILQTIVATTSMCAFTDFMMREKKKKSKKSLTGSNYKGRTPGSKTIPRTRKGVDEIYTQVGPHVFRKMFRMTEPSFWKLFEILEPKIIQVTKTKKRSRGGTPNGDISNSSRLSMALRYFAGGSPYDIALTHGVGENEVLKSVWGIVDAINQTKSMDIIFPQTYEEQLEVARGFQEKSAINIDCCVGAIDGLLIWIHKPSKPDVLNNIEFGPKKFYCGRKSKFGMNMQATCDSRGYFLDVSIDYPGASSDFYAFSQSDFRKLIEQDGFLRPGLCIFGDNAYVNTHYMITPYKAVESGPKDAFNYFHSSLRINIECAFGMLVHRWGILRKAIPIGIAVKESSSLVVALCKLHNFCITEREEKIPRPMAKDVCYVTTEGGLTLPRLDYSELQWQYNEELDRVDALLDGGEHRQDDEAREWRRRLELQQYSSALPAKHLLDMITEQGYSRVIY